MENKQPTPEVGMGATIAYWCDRHAGTIVHVSASKREIWVQRDRAVRTDNNGLSESQTYEFSIDNSGPIYVATLRKNGRYVLKGESMKNGTRVSVGHRSEFENPSY
ncbi:MAG: hypothetical protein JO270_00140 [Acidobacteriaceae bacterium]|nr:hypothetical protein [Acidobacteriaceae bacterium]